MNKWLTLFLVLALSFSFASADWKALGADRAQAEWQVRLLDSSADQIKLEITVPGYHEDLVNIGDNQYSVFHIPGTTMLMNQGFPTVPQMARLLKIEHDSQVKLEVLSKEVVEVDLKAPILPSKGHLNRNIDPESIALECGPIYQENAFWPYEAEQFQIGQNFEFREIAGIRLQVLPLSANHVQMKMRVIKKAVLSLSIQQDRNKARVTRGKEAPNKTYRKMYSKMFLNYEEETSQTRGTVPDANNKKLVVVTPAGLEGAIPNWVNWKRQCGYEVTTHVVNSGVTAGEIKTYLQGLYDNVETRFGYVVLIGDAAYNTNFEVAQPMPTFKGKKEGAAADRVYVRLAGNDNYPDAFISRISGTTQDEIATQLNKIVAYEQSPTPGKWFTEGICVASNQGSPTDKERAEWLQNGGGASQNVPVENGGLIGYGYTYFDDIYDPYASASTVANAVNSGRSIICYIGHGSSTSWGSSGFSNSNIASLTNGGMLPVIWSVACVNGQFVHTGMCFAEAWLRKANGGAVAMEAASTNESWVPPCDKQSATVNAIINKDYFTFGALEAAGCIRGLEEWQDTDSSEGNKMAEQCHLFGDCTMLVRTKTPQALTANQFSLADNSLSFQVLAEGRAPQAATVTIYNADMSFVVSGDTDEYGNVVLSMENRPNEPLFFTAVGVDAIPVINQPLE